MLGTLGFSYTGLIILCSLFIPNICYAMNQPVDKVIVQENKILVAFERIGQASCTVFLCCFKELNIYKLELWLIWLLAGFFIMALYICCWMRYFSRGHRMADFCRPFLGIPVPLALLPVVAVLFMSVYGKLVLLGASAIILGIGHIGITWQYWKAVK